MIDSPEQKERAGSIGGKLDKEGCSTGPGSYPNKHKTISAMQTCDPNPATTTSRPNISYKADYGCYGVFRLQIRWDERDRPDAPPRSDVKDQVLRPPGYYRLDSGLCGVKGFLEIRSADFPSFFPKSNEGTGKRNGTIKAPTIWIGTSLNRTPRETSPIATPTSTRKGTRTSIDHHMIQTNRDDILRHQITASGLLRRNEAEAPRHDQELFSESGPSDPSS